MSGAIQEQNFPQTSARSFSAELSRLTDDLIQEQNAFLQRIEAECRRLARDQQRRVETFQKQFGFLDLGSRDGACSREGPSDDSLQLVTALAPSRDDSNENKRLPGSQSLPCPKCDTEMSRRTNLYDHFGSQHSPSVERCRFCSTLTKNVWDFERHFKSCKSKDRYHCDSAEMLDAVRRREALKKEVVDKVEEFLELRGQGRKRKSIITEIESVKKVRLNEPYCSHLIVEEPFDEALSQLNLDLDGHVLLQTHAGKDTEIKSASNDHGGTVPPQNVELMGQSAHPGDSVGLFPAQDRGISYGDATNLHRADWASRLTLDDPAIPRCNDTPPTFNPGFHRADWASQLTLDDPEVPGYNGTPIFNSGFHRADWARQMTLDDIAHLEKQVANTETSYPIIPSHMTDINAGGIAIPYQLSIST